VSTKEIIDAAKTALAQGEISMKAAIDDLRPRKEPLPPLPARADEVVFSVDDRIAHIGESFRCDRLAAAGLGLIELRRWYEASDPSAFGDDGRTWSQFIATRLPAVEPAAIERLIGKVLFRGGALECMGCGAHAVCQCGCGAPYVVAHPWAAPAPAPPPAPATAFDRATAALAADPGRSDRAIAAEIGVSAQTVKRARAALAATPDDVAPDVAPDGGRLGRDGKRYRKTRTKEPLQ
jgi:hypothetical protein